MVEFGSSFRRGSTVFGILASAALVTSSAAAECFDLFERYTRIPVSSASNSVFVADINRDGIPDVIRGDESRGSVFVLLGKGGGSFENEIESANAYAHQTIAVGDVNSDELLDVITVSVSGHRIHVLRGDGQGKFQTLGTFATGQEPLAVCLTDLDGNGTLDVVTGNRGSRTVSVLIGDGFGGFGPPNDFAVGRWPESVTSSDLNQDGKLDIVTANVDSDRISVLLGDGQGGFSSRSEFLVGDGPIGVAIADMDGDSILDLLVANSRSEDVTLLRGDGSGSFGGNRVFPLGDVPSSILAEDVNGDNVPDIVAGNYESRSVTMLLGDGTGETFDKLDLSVEDRSAALGLGDLNGDGSVDIVSANDASSISLLMGRSLACASQNDSRHDYSVGDLPSALAVADLNNDGKFDIVTANDEAGTVTVRLGDGQGGFDVRMDYPAGNRAFSVATAHLNRDGNLDVVVSNMNPTKITSLLGDGTGGLHSKRSFDVGFRPYDIAVGDINGDGIPDAATANESSGTISILLGDGFGGFANRTDLPSGRAPRSIQISDLTRDGVPDIAVVFFRESAIWVYPNDGLGHFPKIAKSPLDSWTNYDDLVLKDINGDGRKDALATSSLSNRVSVSLGNGRGHFKLTGTLRSGDRPKSVALTDVNGDGADDAVVANSTWHSVSVFWGDGNGNFSDRRDFTTGLRPRAVVSADLDGNGRGDAIVANSFADTVSVLTELSMQPPIADSGGPYSVPFVSAIDGGVFVQLNALGSWDPQGDALTYFWIPRSKDILIDNDKSPTPIVAISDSVGLNKALPIELLVSDGVSIGIDETTVTVHRQVGDSTTDTVPPVVACPEDIVQEPISPDGNVVYFEVSASDDRDDSVQIETTPLSSGDTFPVGTRTEMSVYAIDDAGNLASCSFVITILSVEEVLLQMRKRTIALGLDDQTRAILVRKMRNARIAYADQDFGAACAELTVLIDLLNTFVSEAKIDRDTGDALVDSAQNVRATIGC